MRRVVVLENIEILPLHTHPWHKVLVLTVAPSSSSSSSQQSLHNMVLMWLPSSPTPVVVVVVVVVAVVEVVVEAPFWVFVEVSQGSLSHVVGMGTWGRDICMHAWIICKVKHRIKISRTTWMLLTVSLLLPSKGLLLGAPDQARNHLEVHLDLLQLLLLLHLHPALPPQAFASALLQHCSAGIDATEWGKNDETEEMWITKLAIYPWACQWLEGARVRGIGFYQGLSCGGQRRFVETLLASDSRLGGRTVKGGVGWHRGVEGGRRIFCLKLSEEIFDNNSFIIS